ncbi:energy transducer TonB [Brevifollis gellanilyticus]|nr:energy transducer TonB [Brevifollis gellanilyticus]
MRHFLPLALVASLVVTGLTSCSTPSPSRQAFPELDAELQRHKKAGSQVVYPVVKHQVKPEFTEVRASGSTWGVMKVGPTGRVLEVKVVGEAPEMYQESIQKALSQWQFQPGTVQGKPAVFVMQVKITFVGSHDQSAKVGKGQGITFEPSSTITRSLFPELTQKLDDHRKAGRRFHQPKPWEMPSPEYPQYMRDMQAEGTVWVAFIVNESGRAESIHVLGKCPQPLQESIGKAVAGGYWEPLLVDGKPHACPVAGQMTFRLQRQYYPVP